MQKIADNIPFLVITVMLGIFILVISFLYLLIRSQAKLAAERNRLQMAEIAHQKALLRSVIESQEAERKRIGRDLHDGIASSLYNLRLTIERIGKDKMQPVEQTMAPAKAVIDQLIADVRNISHNLSPEIFTIQTLSEAIEELCFIVDQGSGISVFLTNEAASVADAFDHTAALAIYRILEELLANTIKHAGAGEIHICMTVDREHLLIGYKDNGKGLPLTPALKKGRGLQNIESRLTIIQAYCIRQPEPGKGYHVQINIPLPAN